MKALLLTCTLLASAMGAQSAMACSQQPTALRQASELNIVLDSEEFKNELNRNLRLSGFQLKITGVNIQRGITFDLSNGCSIGASLKYIAPSHPGMCPKFEGVLASTICP
jgi:hypothetical protein